MARIAIVTRTLHREADVHQAGCGPLVQAEYPEALRDIEALAQEPWEAQTVKKVPIGRALL